MNIGRATTGPAGDASRPARNRLRAQRLKLRALRLDDLALALAETRPYGRVFHENLVRHAVEDRILLLHEVCPGRDADALRRFRGSLGDGLATRRGWRLISGLCGRVSGRHVYGGVVKGRHHNCFAVLFLTQKPRRFGGFQRPPGIVPQNKAWTFHHANLTPWKAHPCSAPMPIATT